MYTRTPFLLLEDTVAQPSTSRCPYPIELTSDIIPPNDIFPFNERYSSPLTIGFRAPNLSEVQWRKAETAFLSYPPGFRIQIDHILHNHDIQTVYYLESTSNARKKWKRIIVTFHSDEHVFIQPHMISK